MAFPNLPTFDYNDPALYVAYADSTVLGMVKKIDHDTTATKKKNELRRVGSAVANTVYGSASYVSKCSITFYETTTQADILAALSVSSPASLDASQEVTLKIEKYDSESSGILEHTWQLTAANPMSISESIDADTGATMVTVTFESANKWTLTIA